MVISDRPVARGSNKFHNLPDLFITKEHWMKSRVFQEGISRNSTVKWTQKERHILYTEISHRLGWEGTRCNQYILHKAVPFSIFYAKFICHSYLDMLIFNKTWTAVNEVNKNYIKSCTYSKNELPNIMLNDIEVITRFRMFYII